MAAAVGLLGFRHTKASWADGTYYHHWWHIRRDHGAVVFFLVDGGTKRVDIIAWM
jgi:hypothetical protein